MPTVVQQFGHGSFTLGSNEFICQVQALTVVSSNTRQDIVTACGTETRFINEQTDIQVQFLQDWSSATAMSGYLNANYNTKVAFHFSPATDNTPAVDGTLTCARPSMGGPAGEPMVDNLVLPCVGGVIYTYGTMP